MATILNTLYPPLIDTFMPAFQYNQSATVNFTISPYNSYADIRYMHVTLVDQRTNQSVLTSDSTKIPSGTKIINDIWIIPFNYSNPQNGPVIWKPNYENNFYTLYIPTDVLKNDNGFITNNYYKLQIRFDSSSEQISKITDSSYLTGKNRAYFSEWSSVCLLKAIPQVDLALHNFTIFSAEDLKETGQSITNFSYTLNSPQFVPGIIPFAGNLIFINDNTSTGTSASTSGTEYLSYYYINILNADHETLLESGKQFPTVKKSSNFYYLFDLTNATVNRDYYVEITCVTNNQYRFTKEFSFSIIESSDVNFNPQWSFNKVNLSTYSQDEKVLVTSEDGFVDIQIKALNVGSAGYLFIKRASSLDHFKTWELLDCHYFESSNTLTHQITDKTVGSLVTYKYSCQFLTQKGSWSQTFISSEIIYPDFHDILLLRGNKQLAIRYNTQIASMTPVVNRVKIDTLGGKYPKFAENAKLSYKQFQLSGLITAESDFNRKFLSDLNYTEEMAIYDARMDGKYIIRNDTIKENYWESDYEGSYTNGTYTADITNEDTKIQIQKRDTQKNTSHDLYPTDNWWWERLFREEAMKWLNDGEPKLFRSMTEGNLIVMLDSISLTPNPQLGRRIWNFNCTVYEVGDGYSLKELSSLGIYPINNDWNRIAGGNQDDSEIPISSEIEETFLKQIYEFKAADNTNGTNIIHGTANEKGYIENYLNQTYGQGVYQDYAITENSVYFKNLKFYFYSPPQWYQFLTSKSGKQELVKVIQEDTYTVNSSYNLGYKMTLTLASSNNPKSSNFSIDVFVNRNGFYQIPSNMVVKEIKLYDGAVVTLDGILCYSLAYNNSREANSYENVERIVGQISERLIPGSDIISIINNNHSSLDLETQRKTIQSVDYLTSISFNMTPYSIIKMSNEEDENLIEYIIGRTGILNFQPDFKVSRCIIDGRRLIKIEKSKENTLNEWECTFDTSEYWYRLDNQLLYKTTISLDNMENIIKEWNDTSNKNDFIRKYQSEVLIPKVNQIYKIVDINGIDTNNIYYLDEKWYNVTLSENSDIVIAKVPVDGMIDYQANIIKRIFIKN